MKKYKLVIFDRDNTLIKDTSGYVHKIEELEWFDGVLELLQQIHNAGIKIAIATNQSGVARGLYDESDVLNLHEYMNSKEGAQGVIDLFRYCPHHPQGLRAEYAIKCLCRKPEPGMILDILEELDIQECDGIIFGDSESDFLAGSNAGVDSVVVNPGNIVRSVRMRLGVL
jgi:D-glycero-D-manno-heptose 1,7-bisphosphate phosphatase